MLSYIKTHPITNLIANRITWIILFASLVLNLFFNGDKWIEEGIKLIPPTIGLLWGGLVATVAIIFALMKEEDLLKLHRLNHNFTTALLNLKNHLTTLLILLAISLLSFFIEIPFVTKMLNEFNIPVINMFYFVESFLFFFAVYSAYEVINSLFLVFEIKLNLLEKIHPPR